MISTAELLERAATGGPDRATVLDELRARGPDTAHAILDRVARTSELLVPWSEALLLETSDSSLLARALDALSTMPSALGCVAYPLLGQLGDPAATQRLLEHFLDEELGARFRVMAARALVAIRDPAAEAPIRTRLERWFVGPERSVDSLLIAARTETARVLLPPIAGAVALAALGNHDFDGGVYALVKTPRARLGKLPEVRSVYPELAGALGQMVRPGLISACRAALSLLAEESKEEMAAVLARIGTRAAIELLVGLTRSRRRATAEVASGWLHVVAGAPLVEDGFGERSERWWNERGKALVANRVYLRGEAWTVSRFFAELETSGAESADRELDTVVGKNLLREQ